MRIDTDIILNRQKYKVIISVEAYKSETMLDGSKEVRKVINHSTLQKLLNEFICDYNKKSLEVYLAKLQSGVGIMPSQ